MTSDEYQEQVLVVPSEKLYEVQQWEGLRLQGLEHYLAIMEQYYDFLPRDTVEEDACYQQLIPYLVFHYQRQYYVIKKLKGSSESRLHHLYMMGVGGHINDGDKQNPTDSIKEIIECSLWREWHEEVHYAGKVKTTLVGLLSDTGTPVSQVHLGMVYLLEGDTPIIESAEPDKMSGQLVPQHQLREYYGAMDSWGKTIVRWIEEGMPVDQEIFQ